MNPSDAGKIDKKLDVISTSFAALRSIIMEAWIAEVVRVIPAAANLGTPILTNTLPIFYDDIAEALSATHSRATATEGNNLGMAHGRERANSSEYTFSDVVHELQIFRKIVFHITRHKNLQLNFIHREIINQSIDDAILESLKAFSKTHHELEQMVFANLSHDLRNPLHVASIAAQLIQSKSHDIEVSALAKRVLTKIGEADTMLQSILDTAIFIKHEKLKLEIEHFDMRKLVEDACADIEMAGRTCKVHGDSVVGYWSRAMLKRALDNLLSNARKFSDPGSVVTVKVAGVEGRLLLAVHNEGTPIAVEEIPRLFKAFERGLETSDVKGWGLGLPFVQHVVESHNGTVVVDSARGRGTTFTISIPLDCRPSTLHSNK